MTFKELFDKHPRPWSIKDGYVLDSLGKDIGHSDETFQLIINIVNDAGSYERRLCRGCGRILDSRSAGYCCIYCGEEW